jgi:hypothetical protein
LVAEARGQISGSRKGNADDRIQELHQPTVLRPDDRSDE